MGHVNNNHNIPKLNSHDILSADQFANPDRYYYL